MTRSDAERKAQQKYYKKNQKKLNAAQKKWQKDNRVAYNEYMRNYMRKQKKNQ